MSGPTKWCAFQFGKQWKGGCVVGLSLLLGLLIASASFKAEFNEGLTAARVGDYVRARHVWIPLARDGNAEAQFRLGWLYENGLGTKQNPFITAQWYRQAAAQGHSSAQYKLGRMSFLGWGMPHDDIKAAFYFLEAANKGHAKAQYSMAILFQNGLGVPKDLRKARYWFGRAIENGFDGPYKAARV